MTIIVAVKPERGDRGRGPRQAVQEGTAGGRRDRPPGRAGRDLRLPRPQRGRQVDDGADADDAAAADRRQRPASAASTSPREGARVREVIGAALQEAALDPHLTAREHMRLQTGAARASPRPSAARRGDELIERVGLAEAADRRVGGYSGGMKRRARPRAGARPPAADPLPRRADHRPRPAEPHLALGGGRAARRRRGDDRLPDDPVPRGGRPPRRPGRDHRPRQDRRRGHARPRSRPRSASRASRRSRPTPPIASAREVLGRFGGGGEARATARRSPCASLPGDDGLADGRPRARRRGDRRSPTCSSTSRLSTTSSSHKTGRKLEGAGEAADEAARGGRRRERGRGVSGSSSSTASTRSRGARSSALDRASRRRSSRR